MEEGGERGEGGVQQGVRWTVYGAMASGKKEVCIVKRVSGASGTLYGNI